jgi:hypothetical protein
MVAPAASVRGMKDNRSGWVMMVEDGVVIHALETHEEGNNYINLESSLHPEKAIAI